MCVRNGSIVVVVMVADASEPSCAHQEHVLYFLLALIMAPGYDINAHAAQCPRAHTFVSGPGAGSRQDKQTWAQGSTKTGVQLHPAGREAAHHGPNVTTNTGSTPQHNTNHYTL